MRDIKPNVLLHDSSSESFDCESSTITELRATSADRNYVIVRNDLQRRTFPAGATIFAEGETGTLAYILLRGDITLFIGFGTPRQRMVTTLQSGQMFGVHALMAGANRGATAVTTGGCEVLAVSEAKLKQKLDESDPFLRYWVDYLSKRVIDLSAQP